MILTIGPGGSGLTFLSWTIVFLRGDTKYKRINGTEIDVCIDPLNGLTAHNFLKDHLKSHNNLCQLENGTKKSVIYVVPTHQKDFDYISKFNCKKIVFNSQQREKELFSRMITCVPSNDFKYLFNSLVSEFGLDTSKQVLLEYSKLFTNYYSVTFADKDEYFVINYDDIFVNLNTKINDLFLFLDYKIDSSRITTWLKTYEIYKEKNSQILNNFEPKYISAIPSNIKLQILKKIITWNHGSCLTK
jgi:hypothetical protein